MTQRFKVLTGAAAGAAMLALGAGAAQAQVFGYGGGSPYGYGGYGGGYGAMQCEGKAQQQRALTGVLGAVVGANTGGGYGYGSGYGGTSAAIGVLGEVMAQGARDKCYREQSQYGYGPQGYGGYGYPQQAYGYGHDPRGYAPGYGDPYGGGYGDPYAQSGYGYGRPGECRYTTGSVRMPDGRVQNQRVRICADRDGRFYIR